MGMFDFMTCKAALPEEGLEDRVFQTKDTPAQMLDQYQIREDGSLWHLNYDLEDRSDPEAEGLDRLVGMLTQVNQRWEKCSQFSGEIIFYDTYLSGWIEFRAEFVDGQLSGQISLVRKEDPTEAD